MDDIRLTTEADLLLCALFNAYACRRKDGMDRADARYFGECETIQTAYLPQISIADISDAAGELRDKDLVRCGYGDNKAYGIELTTDGIIYMEHQWGDKVDKLLDRIGKLRQAVLG